MIKISKMAVICGIVAAVLVLAACGTKGGTSVTQGETNDNLPATAEASLPTAETAEPSPTENPVTNTPSPSPEPTKDPDGTFFDASTKLDGILGKFYEAVMEDSEISQGNAYRLRKKLDAAKNGEKTVVLFIGGSVTEGALATERTPKGYQKGYAYLTYEYIRDMYGAGDKSNVEYVNVGVSGTSSALGMVRVQEDVLDYEPDIIFIEFAVNNGTTPFDKKTYESLIRRCLKQDNEPAVFLLFSAATYAGAPQIYMQSMGKYYDLPMVSMQDGLKRPQLLRGMKWEDFSSDNVHPGQDGHLLYAKAICKTLKRAYDNNQNTSYEIPELPYQTDYDKFENMVMINNTDAEGFIVDTGCFEAKRTPFSSTGGSDNHALENGWVKTSDSGNDTFTLKLVCNTFTIVGMQTNASTEVTFDIYVDGEKTHKIVTSKSGAWRNPDPQLVYESDEAKEHVIEIRTNETSENAGATILAFGYTK